MIGKLSSKEGYTVLQCGEITINIMAPAVLVKYSKVLNWKDGMLTVLTEYSDMPQPVPEYLDIADAFSILGFSDSVWQAIDSVEVSYD